MAGIRTDNTFEGGMAFDSDKQKMNGQQYLDSINGTLLYNKQGSISWENVQGNRLHVTIAPNNGTDNSNYIPLGYVAFTHFVVVFLTNGTNSEIGIFNVKEKSIGQYKTMFNDANDPNGDLLNFQFTNQIEARNLEENDNLLRVYWVDGVAADSNTPRVFTIDYNELMDPLDINSYSPVTTTVHAINIQAEINFGIIKFDQTINGSILSGSYKFCYRLRTKDGYASPWSPLTQRLDVTTDIVSSTNWNEYEMEGSGLTTSKGFRLTIKGVDDRYDILQIAYVFFETPDTVADARIFKTINISSDIQTIDFISNVGTPLNTEDIAAIYTVIGGAKTLNIKDAVSYYGNIKEGNLDFTKAEIDTVLNSLSITPKIRDMRSDTKNNYGQVPPNPYNIDGSGFLDQEWSPPITHQVPTANTTIERKIHSTQNESYTIVDDYLNYKGTQVSHMYKGYFRGETYRFGIVFYDKKGFPGFVYHLADFTFPEQYSKDYTWKRLDSTGQILVNNGSAADEFWVTNDFNHLVGDKATEVQNLTLGHAYSELRILGLEFNGIDIGTIKDKISMVKIVRVKREGNIVYQGLNVPLVFEPSNDSGQVMRPMNSIEHSWRHFDSGLAGIEDLALYPLESDRTKLVQESCRDFWNPGEYVNIYRPENGQADQTCASCVWAPDLEFDEQRIPITQTNDKLRVVSSCFTYPRLRASDANAYWQYAYGTQHAGGGEPGDTFNKDLSFDGMLKLYFSNNGYHLASNSPAEIYIKYGAEAIISGSKSFTSRFELGGRDDGFMANYILFNEIESYEDRSAGWNWSNSGGNYSKSYVKQGSFYYRHNFYSGSQNAFAPLLRHNKTEADYNFAAGSDNVFTVSQQNAYGFHIANYIREASSPYGGLDFSALETNIFIDTGYTCPIGNSSFTDPAGDIINEAEVWGGDCYLDYVGIQAYYPRMWLDETGYPESVGVGGNHQTNDKVTTSIGIVFPLESELNHTMRNSPSDDNAIYSDKGARPAAAYYEGDGASQKARNWKSGLYQKSSDTKLIEEFNLNEVLTLESIIKFYFPQPLFFDENLFKYPTRWRYTPNKFYGDPVDTWRIFLANDFNDLQGRHGQITSSAYIFDQIYSFQEKAYGRLRAFNRTALVTPDQGNLTTGLGDALDGVDYISTEYGNQHQWGLFNSDKALYWVDINKQKIMRHAQDGASPLSDMRNLHDYIKVNANKFIGHDNPAYGIGISSTYDYSNSKLIISFMSEKFKTLNGSQFITNADFGLNETMFFDVNALGVVLDITTDYNIFYICLSDNNGASVVINGSSLGSLVADKCYRITRKDQYGNYIIEEVSKSEITPYRYNLVYAEDMNVFSEFYSNKARMWFTFHSFILSAGYDALSNEGNKNKVWLHEYGSDYGSFYGEVHKSLIKINIGENGALHKVFDSIRINSDRDDLFSYFVFDTDNHNYWIYLPTFSQRVYKENISRFPIRWEQQKDRTRGKTLGMSFDIDNVPNEMIRISSIGTNYRISNRV